MSRIGKKPIPVAQGVTVSVDGNTVKVKGPKGELQTALGDLVKVKVENSEIVVAPRDDSKLAKAAWGLSRTLVNNMVLGVTQGFTRKLEITGVGYRAAAQGSKLQLNLGYSHDVVFEVPKGVTVTTPRPTEIQVAGIDKQQVGQVAAEIRGWRPPEPYKGKGVRYSGEYIHRKEGKKK
ncbi:MAG: 50S ribosomal protein L6 [Aestuariivirgaceae bacterium]